MNVATIPDTDTRARMVMDRLEYEADPDDFAASVEPEQQALRDKLTAATASLKQARPARRTLLRRRGIGSIQAPDAITRLQSGPIVLRYAAGSPSSPQRPCRQLAGGVLA